MIVASFQSIMEDSENPHDNLLRSLLRGGSSDTARGTWSELPALARRNPKLVASGLRQGLASTPAFSTQRSEEESQHNAQFLLHQDQLLAHALVAASQQPDMQVHPMPNGRLQQANESFVLSSNSAIAKQMMSRTNKRRSPQVATSSSDNSITQVHAPQAVSKSEQLRNMLLRPSEPISPASSKPVAQVAEIEPIKSVLLRSSKLTSSINAYHSFATSHDSTPLKQLLTKKSPAQGIALPNFRDIAQRLPRYERSTSAPSIGRTRSHPSLQAAKRPFPPQADISSSKLSVAAMDADSLVHNACKLYPTTISVVETALKCDPDAVRRSFPLVCNTGESESSRRSAERFSYPINIALRHGASHDVVVLLAQAGPDVIILPDGPDKACSLGIALNSVTSTTSAAIEQDSTKIPLTLLSLNPAAARVEDRYKNTPLHMAVRSRMFAKIPLVRALVLAYPEALQMTNFHGETPLDVAIRSNLQCPESVMDFLRTCSEDSAPCDLGDDLL